VSDTIAPNILDRQFHATQPNRKWIADFTYVWTAEGWLLSGQQRAGFMWLLLLICSQGVLSEGR
jgi:transposase InsO family protein